TGLVKIPLLYREARVETGAPRRGLLGSFVLGFAFAFGWTPCIGPILTAILLLAARRDTVIAGMFLLAVYSAGLAIPFLLTGLGLSSVRTPAQRALAAPTAPLADVLAEEWRAQREHIDPAS